MSSPLVTVGIPFFNARATLFDAIRSAFSQSFSDWELILMDDGSTDGGLALAESITDSRVRVYSDGSNLKVTARRNQIVELARGRYFAWLDADDLMHPERLTMQVQYLDSNPSIDVVGTGIYIVDAEGHVAGKRFARSEGKPTCKPSQVPLMQPTVMGRIEWFRQNLQDSSLERAADMELWLRTAPSAHFANLLEPLCFYTEAESFSPKKYRRSWGCTREVIRRHGPRLAGRVATYAEILKGYGKIAVFTGAYYCGLHGHLIRRRSLPVSEDEKAAAEAVLERIRRLELPLNEKPIIPPRGQVVEGSDKQSR